MSGNRPGVRAGRAAPRELARLSLDIHRTRDSCARQAVRAELRFDAGAPLAVTVAFLVDGAPRVTWLVGRDLLRQGLFSASGLGDVQMWPATRADDERATAWLRLKAHDTTALFELPVPPLANWLAHTYELVPAGEEMDGVDWDAVTTDLLAAPESPSG
ncbi:SsgA family sporulation/cell division regulator [Streptomyces sp. NPDC049954]|uniref:SsgA family sporulation/cell division regulator n=1 Tax=Streptomyces sp. NPDC049954 TaxID=3155779 RepID=UPI003417896C